MREYCGRLHDIKLDNKDGINKGVKTVRWPKLTGYQIAQTAPLSPLQRKSEAPFAFLEVLYKPPRMTKRSHTLHLPHQAGITDIKPSSQNAKVCRFRSQAMDAPPSEFTLWPQGPPHAFHDHPDLRIPSPRGPPGASQAGSWSLSPLPRPLRHVLWPDGHHLPAFSVTSVFSKQLGPALSQ